MLIIFENGIGNPFDVDKANIITSLTKWDGSAFSFTGNLNITGKNKQYFFDWMKLISDGLSS